MKNVIKQSESVSSNVERGIDFGKVKLSKKVIQKSLELETLFKSNDKVYINDSFGDYPPSYMISFKYKNPNGKKDSASHFTRLKPTFAILNQRTPFSVASLLLNANPP